jgi:hypothetical protein
MKKLIFLLPLLILFAGCMKTNQNDFDPPPAPLGSFNGKFTHTHTDPISSAKTVTTANIQFTMAATGFTVTSDDAAVHANGSGEYFGDEVSLNFVDLNYPATGPVPQAYLYGNYNYTFNGTEFKLTRVAANDLLEYVLVKN